MVCGRISRLVFMFQLIQKDITDLNLNIVERSHKIANEETPEQEKEDHRGWVLQLSQDVWLLELRLIELIIELREVISHF